MADFFWGQGGEKVTPQMAARQRQMADALMGQNSGVADNGWEGLAQVARAFTGTQLNNRAAEAERIGQEEAAALFGQLDPTSDLSSLMTAAQNPWASDTQLAIAEMLMQQELQEMDPLRQLQIQAAQQGVDLGAIELDQARNPAAPMPEYAFEGGQWWQQNPDGSVPFAVTDPVLDPTTGMQDYDAYAADEIAAGRQPLGRLEYEQAVRSSGATRVNNNIAPNGQSFAPPPFGQDYRRNPDGTVAIDPVTGMPEIVTIPNGPQALEADAAAAQQALGNDQDAMYADIVSEDIGRALELLESDPTFTTGVFGQLLGNLRGSNADRLDQFLNTVRSNVAFDRLQAMREASPTGGALGSVTERELALLESTIGSLERSSPEDLTYNLKRVQEIYDRVMEKAAAYPNAAQFGFGGARNQSTVDANDIDALLELYQ